MPTPLEPPRYGRSPCCNASWGKKSTFGSGELTLKFEDKTLLVAKKTSRSGNYHISTPRWRAHRRRLLEEGWQLSGKDHGASGTGVDLAGGSAHHRVLVDGSQQKNEHALFIHKRTSTLTSFVDCCVRHRHGRAVRRHRDLVRHARQLLPPKSELLTRVSHSDDKLTVLEQASRAAAWMASTRPPAARATVASVKNFQLVPGLSDDTVVFQLGKIGDHDFNLDRAAVHADRSRPSRSPCRSSEHEGARSPLPSPR